MPQDPQQNDHPELPEGLTEASQRWWRSVVDAYDLSPGHLRLAEGVCRAHDRAEELRREVDRHGLVVQIGGRVAVSSLVAEERAQRESIRRALATLDLDVEEP